MIKSRIKIIVHKPNTSGFFMGTAISINKFGERGEDHPIKKPESVYRIVAIGDSVTLGWGVDLNETYAKKLESKLNDYISQNKSDISRVEVINMGIGNYNTVQEVHHFIRDGLRYQPDMILVGYIINDPEPVPNIQSNFISRRSYLYVLIYSSVDRILRSIGMKPGYEQYYRSLYADNNDGWSHVEESLNLLAESASRIGSKVITVSIPELRSVGQPSVFSFVDEKLKDFGSEKNIEVINLYPIFHDFDSDKKREKLWVNSGDSHPSPLAHEIIANELAKIIFPQIK
ncbi:hypothetical protein HZB78_00675 [Candidatus Collierbacteria bacterium]|nr:hypothetical protein [Candidatus Collierbacteria bacterium]